jgi:hypothetical protein
MCSLAVRYRCGANTAGTPKGRASRSSSQRCADVRPATTALPPTSLGDAHARMACIATRNSRTDEMGNSMHHALSMRIGAYSVAVFALAATAAHAQFVEPDVTVLYTLTSDQANDGFGFAAEAIGDLNEDGASEIIIGALRNSSGGMDWSD